MCEILRVSLFFIKVCRYYLCGFCPAELFTNTRSDLGKSRSCDCVNICFSTVVIDASVQFIFEDNSYISFPGPCEKIHDENLRIT